MITLTKEEAHQVLNALKGIKDFTEKQLVPKAYEILRDRLALHDMNKAAEENGEEL